MLMVPTHFNLAHRWASQIDQMEVCGTWGIDGFSRTIVYLHCSTNNFPSTVMASFADAVCKYGVPNQIRSDRGRENVQVWEYMLEQHRSESAVLVGSSTHNERIERLWRDVYRCVGILFADLFREMPK